MENLFPALFLIIGAVVSIMSSSKKAKEKQAAEERRRIAAAARVQAAQQRMKASAPAKPATPVAAPAKPLAVAQPQVHTHTQPDCETHDKSGSLHYTSTEGKDPCHETQLTHLRTVEEAVQEKGGLTFDWSGENLVKAFVMQEVLTRPAQRRAR